MDNQGQYHAMMKMLGMKVPKEHYEMIVCSDGFKMSVQASRGHYCSPKDDNGPYTTVEVGLCGQKEPLLEQYAETPDSSHSACGWVPMAIVRLVIKEHGGQIAGVLPPTV